MLHRALLFVCVSISLAACGARSEIPGESPDAGGIVVADASTFVASTPPSSLQFIDVCSMPGATHELSGVDDGMGPPISLPFTFRFFGTSYTAITPSADGYIGLGSSGGSWGTYGIFDLPSTSAPSPVFFYYSRDLYQRVGGVCAITIGTAASRMFVLEMNDAYHYADASTDLTIETFLEEGTNAIDVIYQRLSGPGTDGSMSNIGAQNADRTRSYVYESRRAGALSTGLRVRFVPM
jgi:hypothetical protein